MTRERKHALKILSSALDNMGYWEEGIYNEPGIDKDKVNEEVFKITDQITARYGLDRKELWSE